MDAEEGGAMNGSEFGDAPVGGAGVYMDYMIRFRTMYMDEKKKNLQLEKDNLELKKRLDEEEDWREHKEMEILIVKGDLNLERNQRISLEEKLRYMTETLWKDRDRPRSQSGSSSSSGGAESKSEGSLNPNLRPSSPSPSFCARFLKENLDANLVMKKKRGNVDSVSVSSSTAPSDDLSTLLGSLSSSVKEARSEGSSLTSNEFNNTRSTRRAAKPKATVALEPTRKSLRRLSAVANAKVMEKEELKKPPSQGNPRGRKGKKVKYGYAEEFITQHEPRKRSKESIVLLEPELTSCLGYAEDFASSYPEGFLPSPRVVQVTEAKPPSDVITATVKLQSTNDYVQALQKAMFARAKKK